MSWSHTGKGQICDFGITIIVEEITGIAISKTVPNGDGTRYLAPELLASNDVPPTAHSDTYSFAMLIYECAVEEAPLSNITRYAAIIHARIGKKQCSPRPDGQETKRVSDGL